MKAMVACLFGLFAATGSSEADTLSSDVLNLSPTGTNSYDLTVNDPLVPGSYNDLSFNVTSLNQTATISNVELTAGDPVSPFLVPVGTLFNASYVTSHPHLQ
jgi:hypothetical protein